MAVLGSKGLVIQYHLPFISQVGKSQIGSWHWLCHRHGEQVTWGWGWGGGWGMGWVEGCAGGL